jgi:PleD family two-component response regulator
MLGGSLEMDDDMTVNRFIFTIPLEASQVTETPIVEVRNKDKAVMVVEDDKDMVSVIRNVLSETYDVIVAYNGKEALAKIEAGASPSLIVSDVIMP